MAYVLRDTYGGSTIVPTGSEENLMPGINRGVLGFGLVILLSVVVLATPKKGTF